MKEETSSTNIRLLSAVGVYRDVLKEEFQYYQVIGVDHEGNKYVILFACFPNYSESIEKSFTRLLPVPIVAKSEETKSEGESADGERPKQD